jgi:hypothetical protein
MAAWWTITQPKKAIAPNSPKPYINRDIGGKFGHLYELLSK